MKVSVIVPVRDEQKTIRELLDGLLSQSRLPDEIIIADGGSLDTTTEIIEEYIVQGAPIRLIRAGAALPGRGRNLAAAESHFEWLAFIDAGIRPARDWLEALVKRAEQDDSIAVIYGSWEPIIDTFFKECAAIAYVPPPTTRNGVLIRPRFIASTLMRRSAWEAVQGFPEGLRSGEDLVFMDRVEAAGFHFVHEPRAKVEWELKPTLVSTFQRFVVYARNNIRAGLWRQWQARILSRYLFIVLLLLGILLMNPGWSWIALLIWLLMLSARAVVSIRRNRFCYPASLWRNIRRAVFLMSLIAVLDAAAILGSLQWLFLDWVRWSRKTPVEASNGA
jgi:glycosyltransferase involved in cell wall biosynthesis